MTAALLLAVLLAQDAGITPEEARGLAVAGMIDMEADVIVADPGARAVVLSAALCEATDRVQTSWDAVVAFHDKPSRKAWERARRHVDRVRVIIGVLGIEPLSCSAWDVSPLVTCLGPVPDAWCAKDRHMLAQVEAADRLMDETTATGWAW
jgi:hypothetical protein